MNNRFLLVAAGVLVLAGCAKPSPPARPTTPPTANSNSSISLTISPSPIRQLDSSKFTVTANDDKEKPLSGAAVTVDLTMPSMEMPKNEIICQEIRPGEYSGKGRFTMSGDWRAHVTVKSAGQTREQNVPLTVK